MIKFESTIYMDALSLLLSDKADLRKEVEGQISQGGDYETDQIRSKIFEEEMLDAFDELSVSELMEYVSINEEGICVDYSDAELEHRLVAFSIPCTFDYDRWKEQEAYIQKYKEEGDQIEMWESEEASA